MAKRSKPKPESASKAKVHKELKDMDIRINELGEIVRDYDIDTINKFLTDRVPDKKLEGDNNV